MLISIVICTYNRDKFILQAIKSIENQQLANVAFELIVINNNSTDNTDAICKSYATTAAIPFRYVIEKKQGLSFARNRGIAEAKGTIISFIDDDAIAQPTFLQNLHNFFSKHPNAVGVGGKVTPIYEKQEPAWMCRHLVGLVSKVDEGDIVKKYTHNKPYPIGCNMSYTKTALQAVGGFNEKLAWRGDDKYIFRAIKKYSNNIFYVPDVAVGHHIDAFRLTDKNVLKLCERIGSEEGLRVKAEGMRATIFTFIDFIYKAIGSFALAAYYYVKGKPAAAKLVIQYRWLALRGLLLSVF